MKSENISDETLCDIYFHGALRKSIDWNFQNEWRLLLSLNNKNESAYNVKFFLITKVFLGNRMSAYKRKEENVYFLKIRNALQKKSAFPQNKERSPEKSAFPHDKEMRPKKKRASL